MKKIALKFGFVIVVVLLAGCAKQPQPVTVTSVTPVANQQQATINTNKFALGPHQGLLGVRQYYFACDSTLLPEKYKKAAAAQAAYLQAHPQATIELQGFASSGASAGYTVAISQQRAQSVADYMQLQNASKRQMKTVAYGAEFAQPYSGQSIRNNCRVDLVYLAV